MPPRVLAVLAVMLPAGIIAPGRAQPPPESPRSRVVFIVDNSAYPEIRAGLERYAGHVRKQHRVECMARPDNYYRMTPPAIRDILRAEYRSGRPELVGAVMVGPIPHALKGDPNEILIPLTLYYEDFDAVYEDRNGDGVYQDNEITNDRKTNATEIWTAWWVPPAMDAATQVKLLNVFLDKLDRYYRDEISGRDQMLWLAGNVMDVEICEGWTVLLKDAMRPLDQKLNIWCRVGQDEGTFRPNKRKEEFGARDFIAAFTLQPWQHAHIITHGNQRGWYWDGTGVIAAPRPDGEPEPCLMLDLTTFQGAGANIVTTSGCSNGDFRGDHLQVAYDRSLGNLLLFSSDTATIAYYGAASPQSTNPFPGFATELVESLKADGGSYLAEGYKKMRNMDYSWGTQHYFFRGGDEKVLSGDPFARYRDSKPFTPERTKAIADKIKAAGWTVVGPG